jgi:hypothetical protein
MIDFQQLQTAKRKTCHAVLAFYFFDQAKQGPQFNVPGRC